MEKGIRDRNGNLKYGRVPLLQLKNPMTLCLTRMRVHLERRTVAARPREREANPLSVVLLRCQWLSLPLPPLPPPLSLRFCGRKSSRRPSANVFGIYAITRPFLAVTRTRSFNVRSRRFVVATFSQIFTDSKLRGNRRRGQAKCSHTMRRLR